MTFDLMGFCRSRYYLVRSKFSVKHLIAMAKAQAAIMPLKIPKLIQTSDDQRDLALVAEAFVMEWRSFMEFCYCRNPTLGTLTLLSFSTVF